MPRESRPTSAPSSRPPAPPKVGIFCASAVDDDLDFALRSIELNTQYPDWCMIVGADDRPDGSSPVERLESYKKRYPWFDYVHYKTSGDDWRGLKSANGMLEDLYRRLVARGCTRFFEINDDIAVTRYWLHYAEDALSRLPEACGVVIPHDGIVSADSGAGFCGFYYFSLDYVRRFHPHGTAYRTDPVQCYWVDTEFCLRAASQKRLVREPRCCVLHLHHTSLPKGLPAGLGADRPRRGPRADSAADGLVFIERMREERIDPWKYIPGLERYTPASILSRMKELKGIEEPAPLRQRVSA